MKSYLILFALLACTMSGCSQINTKIGLPWTYWEHGFWPGAVFVVVCCLILFGLLAIFVASFSCSDDDDQAEGPLYSGVGILLSSGLLLQALPYSDSGIQFIPLLPSNYGGQIAWVISISCWSALALGGLFIFTKMKRAIVAGFVLAALVLNASLSFCSTSIMASQSTTESVVSCPPDADQWEQKKQQYTELLNRLSHEKEMLETRIKNLGIRTKKELMDHRIAGPLVEELEQLIQQIAKVQNNIVAVESVLSKLRSIEREKALNNAGLSAEELTNISQKLKVELLNKSDDMPDSAVQRDKLLNGLIARPEGGK